MPWYGGIGGTGVGGGGGASLTNVLFTTGNQVVNGSLSITPTTISNIPITVNAFPSQSANLFDAKDSVGNPLTSFDKDGYGFPRPFTFGLRGALVTGFNLTNPIIVERNSKIIKAYALLSTPPTGASVIADIILNGNSIWSGNASSRISVSSNLTTGVQTSFVFSTLKEGDQLTFDIPQIGAGFAPGYDLTVQLLTLTRNQ